MRRWAILWALWGLGCGERIGPPASQPKQPAPAAMRYVKGQLHLHSNASGDSQTPPEDVVRWYGERDYDFIVFTDHNRITQTAGVGSMLVFPGIELTANLEICDPPPEPPLQCLLHVNGLFVDATRTTNLPRMSSTRRVDVYAHALRTVDALGGLALLNHPNFHYGADAATIGALAERGLRLLEVANEAIDSNNAGDASHPSTEALWDAVLSQGHRVYAVATDDAHHYDDADQVAARGEMAFTGDRGWVMVNAERDEAQIREALLDGDFYASTGVELRTVERRGNTITIEVASPTDDVEIRFSSDGGRLVQRVRSSTASFDLATLRGTYVRATVIAGDGRRAWSQPWWKAAPDGRHT